MGWPLHSLRLLNLPPFQIGRFASQFLLTHARQDADLARPPPSLASWAASACLPSGKLSLLPGSSVIMMRMRGGGGGGAASAAISDTEAPNPNSEMELIVEA